MAKVELSYNPYLLETKVLFNGKEPRINSLVEKYKDGSLYAWIDQMPNIFHDEMNGYDFELDFSGTDRDYEAIVEKFENISEVKVFHRNHIGGRHDKHDAIEELLEWFKNNPNRQFDYGLFCEANAEFLEGQYPFLILNGGKVSETMFKGLNVSADNVDGLETIEDADMNNVPILVCINAESILNLEHNIVKLLNRTDVTAKQIFFLIHPSMNKRRICRTLNDLGVENPKIINDEDITSIRSYVELFPLTKFIRDFIELIDCEYKQMKSDLNDALANNELAGKDTREIISELSEGIDAIKQAKEKLLARDNLNISSKCFEEKDVLEKLIKDWRKKWTKIVKDDDAIKYAGEFEDDLRTYFSRFQKKINRVFDLEKELIERTYLNVYRTAGFDVEYHPDVVVKTIKYPREIISVKNELLRLKYENYVEQKDLFGNLFAQSETLEMKREITYYHQEWRDYAEKVVMPMAQQYIEEKYKALCNYETEFANKIIEHLTGLENKENEKKSNIVSQLSETDRELQVDEDWLTEIYDRIENIKRG